MTPFLPFDTWRQAQSTSERCHTCPLAAHDVTTVPYGDTFTERRTLDCTAHKPSDCPATHDAAWTYLQTYASDAFLHDLLTRSSHDDLLLQLIKHECSFDSLNDAQNMLDAFTFWVGA